MSKHTLRITLAALLLSTLGLAGNSLAAPDLPDGEDQLKKPASGVNKEEGTEKTAAATTIAQTAETTEAAATASIATVFDSDGFKVAAAAGSCGSTTACGKPLTPYWNSFCNNFCLNAGYYGGVCERNGKQNCCTCAAILSPA